MARTSPFHAGEQAVQRRLGVRDQIEEFAQRVVRPCLPAQHRDFYAQLPFVVAAARDDGGRPWATLLARSDGQAGALHAPDERRLVIYALPVAGDALEGALRDGDDLGLLGIELATRRRNRVNGRVEARSGTGLALAVGQSFGNCPQYITEREWKAAPPAARATPPLRRAIASFEDDAVRAWIERADTFFIASGHREPAPSRERGEGDDESKADDPRFGMDASHRGGPPGFVRIEGARHLVFPDYAGNHHYNTLGNLAVDPRAGLLFVDFETGSLLQLTGRSEIEWQPSPEALARFPGALRLVHFALDEAVLLPEALPIRWQAPAAEARGLRVAAKIREATDITSFVLEAAGGERLPHFDAGQHLPVELEVEGPGQAPMRMRRSYSLSGAPGAAQYRISVKREERGTVSRFLHDHVSVGDTITARAPQGEFTLADESGAEAEGGDAGGRRKPARPIVLASAGIGLTPLLSMLHALVAEDTPREVWWIHGARDAEHHALAAELRALVARAGGRVRTHIAYSAPRGAEAQGPGHSRGRVDASLIERLLPSLDADFYLCGPPAFLGSLEAGLVARGVPTQAIRFERF